MINRLLRPQIVSTELVLSVLLVFAGVGEKLWGNEPHSAGTGNFILILGAICVVCSLSLFFLMLRRRGR